MREMRERLVKQADEVYKYTCDVCGLVAERDSNPIEFGGFTSISKLGGYNSRIGDMYLFEIDMCEKCLLDLLGDYARVSQSEFYIG